MSPLLHEAIGLGGFATNVIGNMLLAHRSQNGWGVRIASNVLWLIYAGHASSFAMTANGVTFLALNVYGWVKWRKEARPKCE